MYVQCFLFRFSKDTVHFALCFLYGGVTALPDNVSVWELVSLADKLQSAELREVASLHIRAKFCHFFHRVRHVVLAIIGTIDLA